MLCMRMHNYNLNSHQILLRERPKLMLTMQRHAINKRYMTIRAYSKLLRLYQVDMKVRRLLRPHPQIADF